MTIRNRITELRHVRAGDLRPNPKNWRKHPARWTGARNQSTVWEISYDNVVEGNHAAQKPVECMERSIRNHEGDVCDPFVGSGTTIIAAERQSRTCYAMEIDPGYVDAAVKRWEAYTGQKGVRDGS